MDRPSDPRASHGKDADPLLELIRAARPETRAETLAHLLRYLDVQATIDARYDDDPLHAIQLALQAVMMLHAGLAPAGSPGPYRVWAGLMETVLQMRRGEPPSLLRFAPPPDPASHPSPPHVVYLSALAAAVASHLMTVGLRATAAERLVGLELRRAGVTFRRRDGTPASRVGTWRRRADDRNGREPIHEAYREAHAMLARVLAGVAPHDRQEVLLRALREAIHRAGTPNM